MEELSAAEGAAVPAVRTGDAGVYYLKPRNEMFYKRLEERFALEKDERRSASWARSCSPAPR